MERWRTGDELLLIVSGRPVQLLPPSKRHQVDCQHRCRHVKVRNRFGRRRVNRTGVLFPRTPPCRPQSFVRQQWGRVLIGRTGGTSEVAAAEDDHKINTSGGPPSSWGNTPALSSKRSQTTSLLWPCPSFPLHPTYVHNRHARLPLVGFWELKPANRTYTTYHRHDKRVETRTLLTEFTSYVLRFSRRHPSFPSTQRRMTTRIGVLRQWCQSPSIRSAIFTVYVLVFFKKKLTGTFHNPIRHNIVPHRTTSLNIKIIHMLPMCTTVEYNLKPWQTYLFCKVITTKKKINCN